jgi:hypothetical protein
MLLMVALFVVGSLNSFGHALYLGLIGWCIGFGPAFFQGMSFDPVWLLDEAPKWRPKARYHWWSVAQSLMVAVGLFIAPAVAGFRAGQVFVSFTAGLMLAAHLVPPVFAAGDTNHIWIRNVVAGTIWKGFLVSCSVLLSVWWDADFYVAGGLAIWGLAAILLVFRISAARFNLRLYKHGGLYREAVRNLTLHGIPGLLCGVALATILPKGSWVNPAHPIPWVAILGATGLSQLVNSLPTSSRGVS